MFNSWSHDIGGFDCCGGTQGDGWPRCPFPAWEGCEANSSSYTGSQLLVRWLQHGALSAVDRVHCGGCNRLFWEFPHFDAMKGAMFLRAALFPYIYSANHRTRGTGISLVHPVCRPEAPTITNQYIYSSTILLRNYHLVMNPTLHPHSFSTSSRPRSGLLRRPPSRDGVYFTGPVPVW